MVLEITGYSVAIYLADGASPITIKVQSRLNLERLIMIVQQSVDRSWAEPGTRCMGKQFLTINGTWVNTAYITRVAVESLTLPQEGVDDDLVIRGFTEAPLVDDDR